MDTISIAEKMLTDLADARKDKAKFRQLAKDMLKSDEVDKELVKRVMAEPKTKIKDIISAMKDKEEVPKKEKKEASITYSTKVAEDIKKKVEEPKKEAPKEDEFNVLKCSIIHEVFPGMDATEVMALVKANPDKDVQGLLEMLF